MSDDPSPWQPRHPLLPWVGALVGLVLDHHGIGWVVAPLVGSIVGYWVACGAAGAVAGHRMAREAREADPLPRKPSAGFMAWYGYGLFLSPMIGAWLGLLVDHNGLGAFLTVPVGMSAGFLIYMFGGLFTADALDRRGTSDDDAPTPEPKA